MFQLTDQYISDQVADSHIIYQRGVRIFECGSFFCSEANPQTGRFVYDIDGNYGDYIAFVQFQDNGIEYACDCPYPGLGCKHVVAVLLDIQDQLNQFKPLAPLQSLRDDEPQEPYLSPQEIKELALEDRRKKAHQEKFHVSLGDMFKDMHLIETTKGKQYCITLHDPENNKGHCTCPDFFTNRLNTCKHLIHISDYAKKEKGYATKIMKERFPFVDIYWDSFSDKPRMFCERPESEIMDIHSLLSVYFDADGLFAREDLSDFVPLMSQLHGHKKVRIQEYVVKKVDDFLHKRQLEELKNAPFPVLDMISVQPYPYQMEGIQFSLYKRGALIGDEMGLGKTLQAIALGILKKEVFGFQKILVVTLASLKEQWKREIERFTRENAIIIAGNAEKRRTCYFQDDCLFKITNYEAVLRDITTIAQFKPDLVILDEAQRIKNFNTKTADAMKCIPRKHSLVLTGTPLENKLEDVYSIVQFLDPSLLSPLWEFAANHFMLSRNKKGKVLGYRNLERLNERLKSIVIRRRKEEVLSDLPDEVVNNYFIDLADAQRKIHAGFLQSLLPLLNKKFLTPMDLKRIQDLLLCMRMVCDSTYLIDRKTNISPKLNELENIIDELVLQNGRKVVIFSEWTTMIFLIAKQLSRLSIPFVELTGKIPVPKRQCLIDEFTNNPDCKVFLSTDAGGTGLNLQAADSVINFELPWNPAKMNQRIGRVSRIGQKSKCINVVNLITKNSIEEKILAGIQLKTDLFKGVFDGGIDTVEFSSEKRSEVMNKLREMMGEEPIVPIKEARQQEEIPEDTPHYLNPKALQEEEKRINYEEEEQETDIPEEDTALCEKEEDIDDQRDSIFAGQTPERLENVLNSGLQFMSGLLEMATGKKIESIDKDQQLLNIDRQTGEVTMKFKLPGF